ncbi:hypothetical protein BJ138DRAFT_1073787 [Hygrophoropsis aurantiaca]|uniref:Uncharacterized protein n=1 Tax=Hygrophoropsis aurantiaca TaxID=72124 RepID=A0ACB7ZTE5_9AGAM|nr:hypothetical protein BJ138DRAFT_1073787 [Hygrophoropsis aurantiaca]
MADLHSSPSPTPTSNPDKIIRNVRYLLYPQQAWYCLALFMFVVGCFQWAAFLHSKFIGLPTRHGVSFKRLPLALVNAYRVVAFRWTLNIGQSYTLSVAEVFISIGYIVLLLVWTFINTTDVEGRRLSLGYWSNRAGMLAASQFPLVTALGTKNNVVSLVTGVNSEKLNFVHRIMARVLMVLLWIHGGSEVYFYSIFKESIRLAWLRVGITAVVALTLLSIVSLRPVRQGAYEFFFYMHFSLVIIILLGSYLHTKHVCGSDWIWPSFVIWALDRSIRFIRRALFFGFGFLSGSGAGTMDATTDLIADNVVRLRLRRPPHFHWHSGQNAYLTMPSVSQFPFEAHPFTIASIDSPSFYSASPPGVAQSDPSIKAQDEDGEFQKALEEHWSQLGAIEASVASWWKELVFIINVRKGFTKRLGEVAARNGKVKVFVDGPYGPPPDLDSYDTSILVAGGSGVSYTLPVFLDIIERARNGKSACRRVVFIWIIRDGRHIQWIQNALAKAVQIAPSSLTVSILVHVTNPPENLLGDAGFCISIPGLKTAHGRPDLKKVLQEEVASAVGSMSVNVCGSRGIVRSVRRALRFPVSSPLNVMRGGPSVTLRVESFGFE